MGSFFNKLYAKHILLILVGALPIALVWEVKNKWIAVPVTIPSALFILLQLNSINSIADKQLAWSFRKRNAHALLEEPASPLKQKVVYYALLFLFSICTLLLPVTGKKVENYLEWQPLLITLLKLSWMPFVVAWGYHKRWRVVFNNKEKETYVLLYTFLVPLLLLFHGIVWYNHLQPSEIIGQQKIAIADKGSNARYGNKYVYLHIKGKTKRFEIPKSLHRQIEVNDTLMITVKAGALGYAYIGRFEQLP